MTQIPALPGHLSQRGGDPDLVMAEYMHVITTAITTHPRSLQKKIGPSEIGHPCARRIAYKLLGTPENETKPNWKATIGTGAHMWLENAFDQDNLRHAEHTGTGQERWLVETKVSVGDMNGTEITGSCDLYDRVTATVIDHKTVGPTQLTNYKRKGASEQYRIQAHLYGRGWQRAGFPVDTVAVAFLPRNGELADSYLWHEPYDEQVAIDALQRLAGIDLATTALGVDALPGLGTADAWCHMCPFYERGSQDPRHGCPGDPAATANKATTQFAGLV